MTKNEEFQQEFIVVMEKLIRSAVAETAKIVENKVRELKSEMERLERQNAVLREEGRRRARREASSYKRTHRDACIQCSGLLEESGTSRLEHGDTTGTPTAVLQDGNQQFALVVVKKEESETHDITPTYYFANLTADQPNQFVVQNAGGSFISQGSTFIPVQLAVYPEQSEKPTPTGEDGVSATPDQVFIPKAEPLECEVNQQGMQF